MRLCFLVISLLVLASADRLLAQAGRTAVSRQSRGSKPLSSMELLLKLYHGTPAAAAAAVKVRGTSFDVTPQVEKQLVEAGADRTLLALVALRRVDQSPVPTAPVAPTAAGGSAIRMDAATQARKLIQRPEPVHPPESRQSGGKVTVEIRVGQDGRVKDARVVSGAATPFAAAALEASRGYIYRPTVLDGEAVEVTTEVVIEFAAASSSAGGQD